MKTQIKGFTLIELAVVTAVTGVLAMMVLPSLIDTLETKRLEAERAAFAVFEDDIRRSFQETDWSRNLAAFPGSMPQELAAACGTVFGSCTSGDAAGNAAWYVKLGRLRGITPVIDVAISESQQKSLFDLAFNPYGQARYLVAAPAELTQQRYLLISVAAPLSKGLQLPPNDGSVAWFDAIWNHDWENEGAPLPSAWLGRLTAAQQELWLAGRGTTTNCHRLVVRRIVQPKFSITLNDAHPTLSGWVDIGGQPAQMQIHPGSDPVTRDGILAGTLVAFRRGITAPGTEIFRVHLNDHTTFTVMSQP